MDWMARWPLCDIYLFIPFCDIYLLICWVCVNCDLSHCLINQFLTKLNTYTERMKQEKKRNASEFQNK